jgi:hypothetical protein
MTHRLTKAEQAQTVALIEVLRPAHRCPTGREGTEVRLLLIPGRTASTPELVLQIYRRVGHDLGAPMGPAGDPIRLSLAFAGRLIEIIQQLEAEAHISPEGTTR